MADLLKTTFIFLILIIINACGSVDLPDQRYSQYKLDVDYELVDNRLKLAISNPLHCPVRIWVQSDDARANAFLAASNPIVMKPLQDSLLYYDLADIGEAHLSFSTRLGDTAKTVIMEPLALPFKTGKSYKYIQGPNSQPTHNSDWSRYALDFGLPIGDTVCAATDGYVVGVIEEYEHGGPGDEWKDYGNFITLYTPETGLFTQYVHLKYKGSLVDVGDKIERGQAIGLAGMTGQTNIEHLHFNCLKAVHSQAGLISIPVDSIGGYRVIELKRGQIIENPD